MYLIQLKMPPDKLAVLIASVERDIETAGPEHDLTELLAILNWMRYRLSLWNGRRPGRVVG